MNENPAHSFADSLPRLRHPDGTPIRALVVDDEASLAELVSLGLRMVGWDVSVAADGDGAIRLARERRPDVVVLDVMMPGIDGVEAARPDPCLRTGRARAVPHRQGCGARPHRRSGRRELTTTSQSPSAWRR